MLTRDVGRRLSKQVHEMLLSKRREKTLRQEEQLDSREAQRIQLIRTTTRTQALARRQGVQTRLQTDRTIHIIFS